MAGKTISQREAHRLRRENRALRERLEQQQSRFALWRSGKHVMTGCNVPEVTITALRVAWQLQHAVIAVPQSDSIDYYAVGIGDIKADTP